MNQHLRAVLNLCNAFATSDHNLEHPIWDSPRLELYSQVELKTVKPPDCSKYLNYLITHNHPMPDIIAADLFLFVKTPVLDAHIEALKPLSFITIPFQDVGYIILFCGDMEQYKLFYHTLFGDF